MISIRAADQPGDRAFMLAQSPRLAAGIAPRSHSEAEIAAFQERFTRESLEEAPEGALTIMAMDGSERLGFLHAVPSRDEITGEPAAYVALLVVVEAAQGQGVADRLLRAAEDWARARGLSRLCLDVFDSNERARQFYARAGFQADTIRLVKRIEP